MWSTTSTIPPPLTTIFRVDVFLQSLLSLFGFVTLSVSSGARLTSPPAFHPAGGFSPGQPRAPLPPPPPAPASTPTITPTSTPTSSSTSASAGVEGSGATDKSAAASNGGGGDDGNAYEGSESGPDEEDYDEEEAILSAAAAEPQQAPRLQPVPLGAVRGAPPPQTQPPLSLVRTALTSAPDAAAPSVSPSVSPAVAALLAQQRAATAQGSYPLASVCCRVHIPRLICGGF